MEPLPPAPAAPIALPSSSASSLSPADAARAGGARPSIVFGHKPSIAAADGGNDASVPMMQQSFSGRLRTSIRRNASTNIGARRLTISSLAHETQEQLSLNQQSTVVSASGRLLEPMNEEGAIAHEKRGTASTVSMSSARDSGQDAKDGKASTRSPEGPSRSRGASPAPTTAAGGAFNGGEHTSTTTSSSPADSRQHPPPHRSGSPMQDQQQQQQQQQHGSQQTSGNRLRSSQMFNMSRNIGDATIRELDEADAHDGSEDAACIDELCAILKSVPRRPVDRSAEHLQQILRSADKLRFFSRFIAATKLDVCREMTYEHFALGEDVYRAGDDSGRMYIVLSGHIDLLSAPSSAAGKEGNQGGSDADIVGGVGGLVPEMGVGPGSVFGLPEMAKNESRRLTARCITDAEAMCINRTCYVTAVRRSATMIALSKVDMLRKLSAYEREAILEAMEFECIDAGATIFKQGDEGNRFYLIVAGKARVSKMEITGNVMDLLALDKKKADGNGSAAEEASTAASDGVSGDRGKQGDSCDSLGGGSGGIDEANGGVGDPGSSSSSGKQELDFQIKYGEQREIRVLGPGDFFGELALINSEPRAATVSALTRLEVITLGRSAYLRLAETASSDIALRGKQNTSGKLERSKLRQILASNEERTQADCELMARMLGDIPFFANLPFHTRIDLSMRMSHETYPPNRVIFLQGDVGDKFFIVITGEVRIDVAVGKDGGQMKEVARVGPGAHFGEVALLRNVPRSATVTATQDCEFLVLDRETYSQVMKTEELSRIATNVKFMSGCLLFNKWSHNLIVKVAYYCSMEEHEKGTELIRQGDLGDKAFIIRSGSCRVVYKSWIDNSDKRKTSNSFKRNGNSTTKKKTAQFSRQQALTSRRSNSQQKNHTASSSRPVTALDSVGGATPSGRPKSKHQSERATGGHLAADPAMSDVDLEEQMATGSFLNAASASAGAGATGAAQGEPSSTWIAQSTESSSSEVLKKAVQVALLGVGDFFGIPSILTGAPQQVSIIADSYCKVMAIPRSVMETRVNDLDGQVRRIALSRDETYVHRGQRAVEAFRRRIYGEGPPSIVAQWRKAGASGPLLHVIEQRKKHAHVNHGGEASAGGDRHRVKTVSSSASRSERYNTTSPGPGNQAKRNSQGRAGEGRTQVAGATTGSLGQVSLPRLPPTTGSTLCSVGVGSTTTLTATRSTTGRGSGRGNGRPGTGFGTGTATNTPMSTIVKSFMTGNHSLQRELTGCNMKCPTRSEQVMFAAKKRHDRVIEMANAHKGGVIETDEDDDDGGPLYGGVSNVRRRGAVDDGWDGMDGHVPSNSGRTRPHRQQRDTSVRSRMKFESRYRSRKFKANGRRTTSTRNASRYGGSDGGSDGDTGGGVPNYFFEVPEFNSHQGFVKGCMEGSTLYLG